MKIILWATAEDEGKEKWIQQHSSDFSCQAKREYIIRLSQNKTGRWTVVTAAQQPERASAPSCTPTRGSSGKFYVLRMLHFFNKQEKIKSVCTLQQIKRDGQQKTSRGKGNVEKAIVSGIKYFFINLDRPILVGHSFSATKAHCSSLYFDPFTK